MTRLCSKRCSRRRFRTSDFWGRKRAAMSYWSVCRRRRRCGNGCTTRSASMSAARRRRRSRCRSSARFRRCSTDVLLNLCETKVGRYMNLQIAVLAAGLSTRLGRPKQLLRFRGKPLIRHAVETAMAVAKTMVVVPKGQFHDTLEDLDVTIIDNDRPEDGVSVSIHLVVEAAHSARILFTLCDQPLVTSD